MFDRTEASGRLAGTGPSRFRQLMENIASKEAEKKYLPVKWATVIRDGAIKIDGDDYEILTESNDYLTLITQHYRQGDRILVIPIEDKRGQVLVLGRPNPVQEIPSFYAPGVIEYFDPTGVSTSTDPGGTATVSVSKMLSKGWILPISRIRVVGRTSHTGEGVCTVSVIDEQNGVIGSQTLEPDGDFDISINREDITEDDVNLITVQLSYDDAVANTANISRTTMLLGEP